MTAFIETPITTNETQLKEEALARFVELVEAKGFIGWQPSPGDLEVILLEVIASLGANAAVIASTVLNAALVQFGVQYLKLAFTEGASATAKTKWTIVPEEGVRHIPAGTKIEAGGYGFQTEVEVEIPAKAATVELQVVAVERGTEYNRISGVAQQVNPLSYVTEVLIVGETTGGEEEETTEAYLQRLAAALALQAPRPITASDFAAFSLQVPSSVMPAGQVIGRATAIDGYNPATTEIEAKVTEGSGVMTEVASYIGITVGTEVQGAGLPKGVTVTSKTSTEEGKKELTLSAKATKTEAKQKYKFIGTYEQGRFVTTFVTNKEGKALSGAGMTALEAWLKEHRELNFQALVREASYNKTYVKAQIHVLPGYETATVKTQVESAIKAFLSPATWGNPNAASTGVNQWLNYVVKAGVGEKLFGLVRYNQLVGVIEAVPGVGYVFAGATGLEIGLEAGAKGTADLAMVGPAPLPEVAELTVTAA